MSASALRDVFDGAVVVGEEVDSRSPWGVHSGSVMCVWSTGNFEWYAFCFFRFFFSSFRAFLSFGTTAVSGSVSFAHGSPFCGRKAFRSSFCVVFSSVEPSPVTLFH